MSASFAIPAVEIPAILGIPEAVLSFKTPVFMVMAGDSLAVTFPGGVIRTWRVVEADRYQDCFELVGKGTST